MQFTPHRVRNVLFPFVVDKAVVNVLSKLECLNCLGPPVGFPRLIGRPAHRRKALDARSIMSSVTNATCPRQSVVPRPYSSSPSTVSLNGSRFQFSGLAGTTSKWLPTKATLSALAPGYFMITLPRPSVKAMRSMMSGPPASTVYGLRAARTWSEAQSSRGYKSCGGEF